MGTRLPLSLRAMIISGNYNVVCMLDDDEAGWNGTASIIKQLKMFVNVQDKHLNCDPKEATVKTILGALSGL